MYALVPEIFKLKWHYTPKFSWANLVPASNLVSRKIPGNEVQLYQVYKFTNLGKFAAEPIET